MMPRARHPDRAHTHLQPGSEPLPRLSVSQRWHTRRTRGAGPSVPRCGTAAPHCHVSPGCPAVLTAPHLSSTAALLRGTALLRRRFSPGWLLACRLGGAAASGAGQLAGHTHRGVRQETIGEKGPQGESVPRRRPCYHLRPGAPLTRSGPSLRAGAAQTRPGAADRAPLPPPAAAARPRGLHSCG